MFMEEKYSGVGISFGLNRIFLVLDELGKLEKIPSAENALITVFDEGLKNESLELFAELLDAQIPSEIYLKEKNLSKQFKYADKKNISFVLILGPDEVENNTVLVRNMKNGEEKIVKRAEIVEFFKSNKQ